jgi:uncharacterized protein (DUF362 family)
VTRRAFLGALPLAAAAACRPARQAGGPLAGSASPMALLPAASYDADLVDVVSRGLRMFDLPVAGRRVLLKPNLVEFERDTAINTHPAVVHAAAVAFRAAGARDVVVAEGPGHRRDTEYLVTASGLFDALTDAGVRFVDLNHDDVRQVTLGSHFTGASSIYLPDTLLAADIVVSMPKLKTHHWAGMTGGMKNLFGIVPGAVYGWPKNVLHQRGIDRSIVDLNATVRVRFTIVDAIVAMEGDGPIRGRSKPMGFLAMGTDVVSVDAACARIIGLDPQKIAYLREAGRFLGNAAEGRIEQRGESPSRYRTRFDLVDQLAHLRA